MNHFDASAHVWDENPIHFERSQAIANTLCHLIDFSGKLSAIEFGAGTGILSLMLKDKLSSCILVDSSAEMLKIAKQKIDSVQASHLSCKIADLEKEEWHESPVDLLFTQMALHHVKDIPGIIHQFSGMIKPAGYLVIADLFTEDGSFHGEGHDVHHGFDTHELTDILKHENFQILACESVFIIKKTIDNTQRDYPVFLLLAKK